MTYPSDSDRAPGAGPAQVDRQRSVKDVVERELVAVAAPAVAPRFSQHTHVQEVSDLAETALSADVEEEIRRFADRLAELKTLESVD